MKKNAKWSGAIIVVLLFVLFGMSGKAQADDSVEAIENEPLIIESGNQEGPVIYGDKVVWMDGRNGNLDIYMYDLSKKEEIPICTNVATQSGVQIHGDKIVWMDNRNGNWDIYMYDLTKKEEVPVIVTNWRNEYGPQIYGDKIVWQENSNRGTYVFLHDLSNSKETQITDSGTTVGHSIYGDKIVLRDRRNGNWDFYMYDLTTEGETQITSTSWDEGVPAVYGNKIVWQGFYNGVESLNVYDLSTSETVQITKGSPGFQGNYNPSIDGNVVVWNEARNPENNLYNTDIFMYDLETSKETRITSHSGIQSGPRIYGNKIVWHDNRNGSYNMDIYMATVGPEEPEPACSIIDLKYGSDYEDVVRDFSGDNLVVVTHGWNGHSSDGWVQEVAKGICDNAKDRTRIIAFDWSEGEYDADTGDLGFNVAFDHAYGDGGGETSDNVLASVWAPIKNHRSPARALSKILEEIGPNFKHIHLIAHSAGSNVIQSAVDFAADDYYFNGTPANNMPVIQLTFLDAFVPYSDQLDRFGKFDGGHDNWVGFTGYAEQYLDSVWNNNYDWPYTNHRLPNVTNFDVTYLTTEANRKHEWPCDFYKYSVNKTYYPQQNDTSDEDSQYSTVFGKNEFKLGFPFSFESKDHIENSATNIFSHKGDWCIVTNVSEPYRRCFDHSVDENRDVIVTDQDSVVHIFGSEKLVDVSQFIGFENGVTTGILPSIKIGSELVCEDKPINMVVEIPSTKITGPADWNGIFTTPTPNIASDNNSISFNIGYLGGSLMFDGTAKMTLVDKASADIGRTRVSYSKQGYLIDIPFCAADQIGGNNISDSCWMNDGNNLVIWTSHFTTFTIEEQNDITPPTTTSSVSGSQGSNDWFTSDVKVTISVTDNDGGSGVDKTEYSLDGGNTWTVYTDPFTVSNEGTHEITYRSTDKAGNIEDVKIETIKIDKTAPEITISAPTDGMQYILNATVAADWSAIDNISGIDMAVGTISSGDAIDTSSVGQKTFTVTAADKAGISVTKTITYNVIYNFGGFQDPIKNGKTFNGNSAVPIQFQLTDANGRPVSTVKASLQIDGKNAVSSGKSNEGNLFRFDTYSSQYIFNFSLKNTGLNSGTHELRIILDDGVTYAQAISVK